VPLGRHDPSLWNNQSRALTDCINHRSVSSPIALRLACKAAKAPGRRARAKEMHFRYWWYWTSSPSIISFLFLPFFPMTTRNGQIKNFTSNSGPQHPAAHGVSRSVLEMNGEVVERAEPHIGSLQCGTKPLTPSRLLCR
jgi:hypothetical protein